MAFPKYAHIFFPKAEKKEIIIVDKSSIPQIEFKIKGMTCEVCTEHINSELSKINGVIEFHTSYENGTSAIRFDSNKTSINSLAKAITKTGYKIVSQKIPSN